MGSTDNRQEDGMLFHEDLTKLRRQRESISLVSKKAIGKTTTLYMQHAFFLFLLWFVEAWSQWYFVWKTHRIWSKKHTDPVNTAHALPVQSVYTKHGAIQILFTGLRTSICPRQHWMATHLAFTTPTASIRRNFRSPVKTHLPRT